MADYLTTDTELTSVANAIRTKGGTSASLVYPTGFVTAIQNIPSGGTDVSDTTATAADVRTGKYFYTSAGTKTQGTIADQAAQTITPGTTDQTIASGKYLTGTQTILGDANLVASNIASGVTIFGVSGTHSGGGDSKENEILDRTISGTYENSTVVSIGVYAFCNCDKLKSVVLQNCTSIKNYAFQYCMSLKTVNTPKCTSIGSYAFYYCLNLNEVTFPLCTTVGPYAFGEVGLYYANFPECSTFGTYAFSGCNQLGSASTGSTGIYIPKCTNVASSMFANCKFLPTISLDKCLNIWNGAFYMCQRILSIYLLGSTVANLKNTNAFAYTPISNSTSYTGGVHGSIYVPASLYSTYIASTNWVTYASRFVSV